MGTAWKPTVSIFVVAWITLVIIASLTLLTSAFTAIQVGGRGGSGATRERLFIEYSPSGRTPQHSLSLASKDVYIAGIYDDDDDSSNHPLGDTSFLSHVMLKVPSVDQTVKYWTQKGGNVRLSRPKDEEATNGSVELLSAFVELGCAKGSSSSSSSSGSESDDDESAASPPVCFALELVSTSKSQESYSIGNSISYIGVSMLLQFQNNLLGAITGLESPESQGDEPNGLRVQSAASAPGDFLARLALKSNNMEATHTFYTTVLGMKVKAEDATMLCLRYDNDCFSGGVPTTLVFDAEEGEIEVGDCFDHFVIATSASIEDIHSRFLEDENCGKKKIFMKPTNMFGKDVMGVIDPNGYKVIIASA
jgi:catechol 2,3-dioxygenase-like lactoylglutathione lyase family enzyme